MEGKGSIQMLSDLINDNMTESKYSHWLDENGDFKVRDDIKVFIPEKFAKEVFFAKYDRAFESKFAHDSIQECLYKSLLDIPLEASKKLHLRIGMPVWKKLKGRQQDPDLLCVTVEHMS
jgi:hypothetical protein